MIFNHLCILQLFISYKYNGVHTGEAGCISDLLINLIELLTI